MISSLTTRARHVCYRKIRKHVETTQQYRSGLARHGNGELAQCGKGEKHQRLLGAVGVGKGQKTSPGTPRRLSCVHATPFSGDFIPFEAGIPTLPDLIVPRLFGSGKLCVDKLKGQLSHHVSHLVCVGDGVLAREYLWRETGLSQWVRGVCVCVCKS